MPKVKRNIMITNKTDEELFRRMKHENISRGKIVESLLEEVSETKRELEEIKREQETLDHFSDMKQTLSKLLELATGTKYASDAADRRTSILMDLQNAFLINEELLTLPTKKSPVLEKAEQKETNRINELRQNKLSRQAAKKVPTTPDKVGNEKPAGTTHDFSFLHKQ